MSSTPLFDLQIKNTNIIGRENIFMYMNSRYRRQQQQQPQRPHNTVGGFFNIRRTVSTNTNFSLPWNRLQCAFGISDVFRLYYFVVKRSPIGRVKSFICAQSAGTTHSNAATMNKCLFGALFFPFLFDLMKHIMKFRENIKQNNRRNSQQFQFRWECATHDTQSSDAQRQQWIRRNK